MEDGANGYVKFGKEVDQIAQLFKALPVEEQQTALKRFQDVLEQLQLSCSNSGTEGRKQRTPSNSSSNPSSNPSSPPVTPTKPSTSVEERLGKLEEQLDVLKRENANLKGTVLQQVPAASAVDPPKRGRGRPRKYPRLLPPKETSQKVPEHNEESTAINSTHTSDQTDFEVTIETSPIIEAPVTRQRSSYAKEANVKQSQEPDNDNDYSDGDANDNDFDDEANDDFPNLLEADDSDDCSDKEASDQKKEDQTSSKARNGPRGPQRKINRHVCRVCQKAFTHGRPFNRHLLKHDPGAVCCRKCHVEFYNEAVFLSHKCDDKPGRKPVERVCRVCKIPFTSLKKLSFHLRKVHNLVSEPEYFCQYCNKGFVKKPSLYLHYREHAGDKEVCMKCGAFLNDGDELQSHMAEHEAQDGFKCDKCKRTFKRRQQYEKHMEGHQQYDCSICGQNFSQKKLLLAHCRSCHDINVTDEGKEFNCSQCEKVFLRPASLESHMKSHSDDQPARCETCDMVFKSAQSLVKHKESEAHLKSNGQESVLKDHLCSICGKTFHKRAALARHMRYHSDDKPHSCPHCDYQCKEQINLKRHINLHFSSRNFICEICGAAFHTKKTLETHRVYKHSSERSYPCSECSLSFKTKSSLLRHGRSHLNKRLHKCTHCNVGFNRMYNLRRHMKSVHGNDQVLPPVKRVKLMDAPEGMEFHKGPAALGLLGKPSQNTRKKQNGVTGPTETVVTTKETEPSYNVYTASTTASTHMMTINTDQAGQSTVVLSSVNQPQVPMNQPMPTFNSQVGVQPQSYYGAVPQNYVSVEPITHSTPSNQLLHLSAVQTMPDNTKWLLPSQSYMGPHDHGRQDGTLNHHYHQQQLQPQIHNHNPQHHQQPNHLSLEQKMPDYTPAELYTAVPGLLHLMHGGPQHGP